MARNEPPGDEVARLERELTGLHARHALMARWRKVLRLYVLFLPVPLLALIFFALRIDPVAGLFFIAVMGLVAGLAWLAHGGGPARWNIAPRWQPAHGELGYGSAAEAIEDLIATRERRLVELKGARR